jgi:(p)ppGpp synthase/HD superfamily hydrolase
VIPDPAFAQGYAARAHMRQKYGTVPYMVHVGQVVDIVKRHNFHSPLILEAAWLHDIIEDTGTTKWDLGEVFDPLVVATVWAVTGTGKNRKERNASVYLKAKHNIWATAIKIADRIANLRYSYEYKEFGSRKLQMYLKEHSEFVRALGFNAMEEVRPLWKELDALYNEIVHWGRHE